MNWALNPRFDSLFLLGSLLLAPLFGGIYWWISPWLETHFPLAPELLFFMFFTALFDAPHIFQTFLRSHGDKVEFRRRPVFHWGSLFFMLLLTVGFYYFNQGSLFIFLLGIFGGWHILRQNLGFLKLYQKKDPKKGSQRWESFFFYFTWLFFLFTEPNSVKEVFPWLVELGDVFFWVKACMLTVWIALIFIIVAQNGSQGAFLKNSPKLIFLFGNGLLFVVLSFLETPYLVMVALATFAHSFQYFGWMHRFQRITFNNSSKTMVFFYSTWLIALFIVLDPIGAFFGAGSLAFLTLAVIYNGFVLWHYFIDGFVWQFSSQKELKSLL